MSASRQTTDIAARAGEFAAALATSLNGDPENRFQGMPSDGDSRAGYAALGRAGWIGLHWPSSELGGRGLSTRSRRWPWRSASATTGCRSRATCSRSRRSATRCSATPRPSSQERLLPEIAAGRLCSARASPSRRPAPTWPRCGPRRGATATASWSRATRSGRRARRSRTGSTWRCAPTRTPRARTAASPCSWPTCARPGSRCARSRPWAAACSARSSSTSVEVPADQLVGELHGGWRVLMGTLDHERVTSEKVGVVLRVLDDLDELAGSRLRAARAARGCAGRPRPRACSAAVPWGCSRAGAPRPRRPRWRSSRSRLLVRRTAELGTRLLGPPALVERLPARRPRAPGGAHAGERRAARSRAGRPRSSAA